VIQDFISYIASERGLSKNTVSAYERDLKAFAAFLNVDDFNLKTAVGDANLTQSLEPESFAVGRSNTLWECPAPLQSDSNSRSCANLASRTAVSRFNFSFVKVEHIVSYLGLLKAKGYASASISRKLMAMKTFFKFLLREGHVDRNVAFYLQTPALWSLIPEILTMDEMQRLLNQPNPETAQGARDKAILEVLYGSGLRVSEVCSLDIQSVSDTFIKVMGKGGKERVVPIGEVALHAIDHYLIYFRDQKAKKNMPALFVTSLGKRIDRISIWKMVKRCAATAAINKNISPHTMRHTFATHLLDHGADLRVIQEMLGHSSISSTDRYTQVSCVRLQQAFKQCHQRY